MPRIDYKPLDDRIEGEIDAGVHTFHELMVKLHDAIVPYCYKTGSVKLDRDPDRVLDGRLQALKRRRRIHWSPEAGWARPWWMKKENENGSDN